MIKKVVLLCTCLLALASGFWFAQSQQGDYTLVDGRSGKAADFEGKTLVVNYFAEWCAPCLKEVPELNQFAANLPADTRFIALSWDGQGPEELAALASKYDMRFDLVADASGLSLPFQRPDKLPATFVVNGEGRLVKTLWGEQTAASLRQAVNAIN